MTALMISATSSATLTSASSCSPSDRVGANDSFQEQIGDARVEFIVVARTCNDFGKMSQHLDSILRILIANLSKFGGSKCHFFKRHGDHPDFGFGVSHME